MIPEYTEEIRSFIAENKDRQLSDVALSLSKKKDIPSSFILDQINGIQKAKKKYPFLLSFKNFNYPAPLSVSQSSSEIAAKYKSSLLNNPTAILDLSGGMGIDSYFLSQKAESLDYVEKNKDLCELAEHNFQGMLAFNIAVINAKAEDHIETTQKAYDLIYIDPDRRKDQKRKIAIGDCEPNLLRLQDQLFKLSDHTMVKFSPMLDIQVALRELIGVKEVHVLSIENENKELLFLLEREFKEEPIIRAVNISSGEVDSFSFYISEEKNAQANYETIGKYLYEPNNSIIKAGAFKLISERYDLKKLGKNTHLYSSDLMIDNFPGRCVMVKSIGTKANELCSKANIISRNSGSSVEEIKKKFKLKEGGENFLYAFRDQGGKRLFAFGEKVY